MTVEQFTRASEIVDRMNQLEDLKNYVENEDKNACCVDNVCSGSPVYLSENMKIVLLNECMSEMEQLKEDFESL